MKYLYLFKNGKLKELKITKEVDNFYVATVICKTYIQCLSLSKVTHKDLFIRKNDLYCEQIGEFFKTKDQLSNAKKYLYFEKCANIILKSLVAQGGQRICQQSYDRRLKDKISRTLSRVYLADSELD